MTLPSIDTGYLLDFLVQLLNTPSPTGYTREAIGLTRNALEAFPSLELSETRKGALVAAWPGHNPTHISLATVHGLAMLVNSGLLRRLVACSRQNLMHLRGRRQAFTSSWLSHTCSAKPVPASE